MRIPIHHGDDGQSHTYFRCGDHHDEKNKYLSVDPCVWICHRRRCMMHFRKGDQQQVHRIQHQFNAHKYDDRVSAREHTGHTDAEERDAEKDIVVDGHFA